MGQNVARRVSTLCSRSSRWVVSKIFTLFSLLLMLAGCAAVGESETRSAFLEDDEGVVVFATEVGRSATRPRSRIARPIAAFFTLGLSEVLKPGDLRIQLSRFDPETTIADPHSFVRHPSGPEENASAQAWHVLKLKAGTYMFTGLGYDFVDKGFAGSNFYFTVKPGESLYLGDFVLHPVGPALSSKYGEGVGGSAENDPDSVDSHLRIDNAERVLQEYPNYPAPLRVAELQSSSFRTVQIHQEVEPEECYTPEYKHHRHHKHREREEREKKRDRYEANTIKKVNEARRKMDKALQALSKKR